MKFHLTDRLSEELDWEDFVSHEIVADGEIDWVSHYGKKEKKGTDFTNPFAILKSLTAPKTDEIVDPTIAIIHADGLIVPGSGNKGLFSEPMVGQRTLTTCLLKVADDDRIKAVVLRINSPGGSAEASESIYQAVRYCADQKPVIVSVSQMAASGGYYIAAGATKIIADPAAITGSIGVVCGKLAYSDLLGKLKIGRHELTRGKNAGMWLSRPWNPHEEELVRKLAERTYDTFVRRVAQSRAGKIKNIEAVAQGRVFTARQALDKGLIDGIGGFREALAAAQGAAKVERCRFINLPRPRTLMDLLSGTSEDDDEETLAPLLSSRTEAFRLLRQAYGGSLPLAQNGGLSYLLKLASLLGREKVLTAMPYYLVVKP
jgi:protease-4